MTLSIRARLTAWYSLVVVAVLVAGAAAVALAQERLALGRLDAELQRLMLTLEGVVRTEFGKGLDLQGAADEASSEVLAPDRDPGPERQVDRRAEYEALGTSPSRDPARDL